MKYKLINGTVIADDVLDSNRYLTRLAIIVGSDCDKNISDENQLLNAGEFRWDIIPVDCIDHKKDIYAVQLPDGTIEAILVDEELKKALANNVLQCDCNYNEKLLVNIVALLLSIETLNARNAYTIWSMLMKQKAIPVSCCH